VHAVPSGRPAASVAGLALIDIVAATALIGLVTAMAVPLAATTFDRERAVVGAQYLAAELQRARMQSLRRGTSVALRIEQVGERTSLQLFVDGNGNGVLQREIDRGIDRPFGSRDWLDHHAASVSLRINQDVIDLGSGGRLAAGSDPLRIGRTALVVFSPGGSSTSGTLYVAGRRGPQLAIRLFGATGRIRVLTFDPQARQWQP
jgi:Tfp pilus assembly protein FimT